MYSCSMVGCKMQQTKRVWLESGSPIKMGGNNENPSEIGSVELNKKRKLQEEHLGLPSPKHKFRDRLCDSEDEHSINIDKKFGDRHKWPEEHKPYVGASCSLEQCESVNDSNSFVEESDTAMTVDVRAEPKIENGINYYHQTSITSGIGSINDYGNNFFSPSSLTINNEAQSTGMSNESNCGNLENDPHLEQGFLSSDHHHELGMNYTDVMCPEYGNDDEEQPLDVAAEEMTLYSNGVPPNSYILSSGRWSVNPGECFSISLFFSGILLLGMVLMRKISVMGYILGRGGMINQQPSKDLYGGPIGFDEGFFPCPSFTRA